MGAHGAESKEKKEEEGEEVRTTIHMRWSSFMLPQILICRSSFTRFLLANDIIKCPPGLRACQVSLSTSRGLTRNSIVLAMSTASKLSGGTADAGREKSAFKSWTIRSVKAGLAAISSSLTPTPTKRQGEREGGR